MERQQLNFNTSHVNVNLLNNSKLSTANTNFNTSHVNVNQVLSFFHLLSVHYFNTSHVNVNLTPFIFFSWLAKFQYISC